MIWLLLGERGRGRREEQSGIRRGKGGGRGRREGKKNILPLAPLFRRLNGDHRTMSRQERLVWFALKEATPHPPISPWFENDHKVTPHYSPLHHCTRPMLSPLHKLCQIGGIAALYFCPPTLYLCGGQRLEQTWLGRKIHSVTAIQTNFTI